MMNDLVVFLACDLEWEKVLQAREQAKLQSWGEFLMVIVVLEVVVLAVLLVILAIRKKSHK